MIVKTCMEADVQIGVCESAASNCRWRRNVYSILNMRATFDSTSQTSHPAVGLVPGQDADLYKPTSATTHYTRYTRRTRPLAAIHTPAAISQTHICPMISGNAPSNDANLHKPEQTEAACPNTHNSTRPHPLSPTSAQPHPPVPHPRPMR